MIILKQGCNMPVFTFNERISTPYSNQYFLWKIKNALTEEEILFTNNFDFSPDTERYNRFQICVFTGTEQEDLNNSILCFTASGLGGYGYDALSQWSYEAYVCEGPMPATGSISLPATHSFVESGRIIMDL